MNSAGLCAMCGASRPTSLVKKFITCLIFSLLKRRTDGAFLTITKASSFEKPIFCNSPIFLATSSLLMNATTASA
uniref:Uncharacterized protein n=1 Tax=Arundo donax TaxID=35708 RepID=A0A0A8Y521_ARUDO